MEETQNSPGPPGLKSFQERLKGFEAPSSTPPGLTPKKPVVPKPAPGPKAPAYEVKPSFAKPVGGINRTAFPSNTNSPAKEEKSTFPKPSACKSPSQTEEPKVPFPKLGAGKPFVIGNNAPHEAKFGGLKPTFPPEGIEEKPSFAKPSQLKPVNSTSDNEVKPPFQKKLPFGAKPPVNVGGSPSENSFNKHNLVAKTFSGSQDKKPIKPIKESTEENMSASPSSQPFHGMAFRPAGIKQIQSPFLNKSTDEPSESPKSSFQMKANQNGNSSSPFGLKQSGTPSSQDNLREPKDPNEPNRKPLPSPAKLGPPPQKPSRPPNVDIERYRARKGGGGKVPVSEQKSSALSSALPPPPPIKSPVGPSSLPSLPPRNIRLPEPMMPDDENYDDVEGPSINDISEESDEELYEGLDEPRKEQEKDEKKRKKLLEQAKKEQREKEKKEQEIRKKFKLTEKVEVIHHAKACMDHKGGKNELSFKNGDQIEVIRVTDNPEGKWLGRMNGTYGYIKTTMVIVDYDSLRRRKTVTKPTPVKPDTDQDIYDDVGEDDPTSKSVGNSFFPPPPSNDDDDIYDGVDDDPPDSSVPQEEERSGTWSWFKKRKGTQLKQKNVSEKTEPEDNEESEFALSNSSMPESDVYDDVETDFPPPPLEANLFTSKRNDTLGRSQDQKTLKRLEKEEKEFRKKFKFTGDIRVLSTVQVVLNLSMKKWGSKDLPLKAGETLDVIQHTSDSTVLCKNSECKYGYVLRSNIIVIDDGEIYDDIGEDCIYDND
ncbi:PREDICTED: FYN-binding protein [Nanorana parkeri]|uniref:FYN-binding protein n=1 Tax=Nanorana parkeri TaxID=125878 RepID=UPI000854DCAF|nr:PREDICTED: FYN-binding protein [Nanorana parkeri]